MGFYNKVLSKVTKGELLTALNKIDTFILETDGVIYAGDTLLKGTKDSIKTLQNLGKNLLFSPNSSTRSRKSFQEKLRDFGISSEIDRIFTPSYITAEYLRKFHPEIRKVYVVGKDGIKQELEIAGLEIEELEDFEEHSDKSSEILKNFDRNREIGAVVVSFDESFSFKKVMLSSMLLERKECLFIATNNNPYLMVEGKKHPGVGPLIAAISKISQRLPDVYTCRPNSLMIELAKESFPDIDLKRTCIVGDKLPCDLKFAQASGVLSMLTLSGITLPQDLESVIAQDINFVIHSFGKIHEILNT